MNPIPDLAVQFEGEEGYTVTPPPLILSTPPPKRGVKTNTNEDSPTLTPPLKSSSQSSATTLSDQIITPSRPSRKSLPKPVTDNSEEQRIGAPLSFLYGLLLGILPFLIVIRFCLHRFREKSGKKMLQERWFKYGRSTGLLLVLVIVIVVLVKVT